METPPAFGPDEKPAPAEFRRMAVALLQELSETDPAIAERLRPLGLAPGSPPDGGRAS